MWQEEKQLKKLQEIYYEALLEQDLEMRKFRHDVKNHMICIEEMAEECGSVDIKKYINNLNEEISVITNKVADFGDRTLNVMVNYYLNHVDDDVIVETKGT